MDNEANKRASTMLQALWESDEETVVEDLADGTLTLTGNFKGHEDEVVASYHEAA